MIIHWVLGRKLIKVASCLVWRQTLTTYPWSTRPAGHQVFPGPSATASYHTSGACCTSGRNTWCSLLLGLATA